jgi:FkbM family methyltransferase
MIQSALTGLARALRGRPAPPLAPERQLTPDGDHGVFGLYRPYSGALAEGYSYSFLGERYRATYGGWTPSPAGSGTVPLPSRNEEYYEWIDILEAAAAAQGTFTFLELGAGFGRWSARAALAARQLGKPFALGMAEPDPKHVAFIRQNMIDNGIDEDSFRIYQAVVSASRRDVLFCVGKPGHGEGWYGQHVVDDSPADAAAAGDYHGQPLYAYRDELAVAIPQIPLSAVLADYPAIDLIDMDLQGAEAEAVEEALGVLNRKVRMLHIGTHGHDIEAQLRQLLGGAGWRCVRDHACGQVNETLFGPMEFNDGVQTWLNPPRT